MKNKINNCKCGRVHYCETENVLIKQNVHKNIYSFVKSFSKILIVADANTYPLAGEKLKDSLKEKFSNAVVLGKQNKVLIPNEEAIETINSALGSSDLIIGIGSGVINDLCKEVSFKHNLPYMIYATAPSMDGYVSSGSALILNGMKITTSARPPKAVFADVNILKDAPMEMIKAGYGDIVGKFSCLNDWKLSALINNEYFCKKIYNKVLNTAKKIRRSAKKILTRSKSAISALMKALIDVGMCMSFVGNSRPASGSEHHLSHYFEITGILNGTPYFPHGIDVGFSSIETAKLREKILFYSPRKKSFDKKTWEDKIKEIYKSSADGIIKLQDKVGLHEKDDYEKIVKIWEEIKDVLRLAPSYEETLKMISDIGLNYDEFKKFYGEDKIKDGLLYAKDLKDRYTVLWLYEYFI